MAGLQYCTLLGNEAAWNSTVEMKAIFSTQTFIFIYQNTWRHIPDDHNFICATIARTHTHTHTHIFVSFIAALLPVRNRGLRIYLHLHTRKWQVV